MDCELNPANYPFKQFCNRNSKFQLSDDEKDSMDYGLVPPMLSVHLESLSCMCI